MWESFISKPEEEQRAFLTQQIAMREAKDKPGKDRSDQDSALKYKLPAGRKSFKKICPRIQEYLNSENMPQVMFHRIHKILEQDRGISTLLLRMSC